MRGLDPCIHQEIKTALRAMDCRVEPSNDGLENPCHAQVLRGGSTMSRRPSPSRLKQNTAIISARPGNNAIHHSPDTMKPAPSATMMPHSAVGGRTPRPMDERPAALRMA